MKYILILTILLSFRAAAQEETILDIRNIEHGGFGGPVVKFTQINDEFGILVGGRGGWIINHTFVIGGGGYGLANKINGNQLINGRVPNIQFGYGGFEMEYIINSDELVHFSAYTLIGAGGVHYRDPLDGSDSHWDSDTETFLVIEPAVNVEINIVKFFRVNFGASYRFLSNFEYKGLERAGFSGPSAVLTFKFGKF